MTKPPFSQLGSSQTFEHFGHHLYFKGPQKCCQRETGGTKGAPEVANLTPRCQKVSEKVAEIPPPGHRTSQSCPGKSPGALWGTRDAAFLLGCHLQGRPWGALGTPSARLNGDPIKTLKRKKPSAWQNDAHAPAFKPNRTTV